MKSSRPATFPKGFVWGAASSSYQVEGAIDADGRNPSVWDMFCRKEGAVWSGQSAAVSCDHYHRYQDDVRLMQQIALQAYRFSTAWPRVLPDGVGKINRKGLAFYDRLVDELLAAGITPWVTLFHWDMPYALYCRGGWLSPDSSDWFAEYTRVVVSRLSDRVRHWLTVNEPQCFISLGHQEGRHAPGDKLGFREVLRVTHNVLVAHGKAVQTIRANAKLRPQIGYAPFGALVCPASARPADIQAARKEMFSVTAKNCWNNAWFMDPIFKGHYPEDGLRLFGDDAPKFTARELATICQPVDFFGVNIYTGSRVRAGKNGKPERIPHPIGHPQTAFHWPVIPDCMYWGARFYWERYHCPIYVTENGMSNLDWVALDGRVHDPQRIDFTRRYLLALERALLDGVDIRGYFHWSILDNFEWADGFKERFGLIHVDYATQKRVLKDSAYWYKEVITSNGKCLHESP
ncbi:MAG: GH1 family beta-glucosidase [Verrucomicrobiia bacterium]|jgi:beta-glucosidase